MIEHVIPNLAEASCYLAALSLNAEKETIEKCAELCRRNLPEGADFDYYRVALAIDLIPDYELTTLLNLSQDDLSATEKAWELCQRTTASDLDMGEITALVTGDSTCMPVKVVLGRLALDHMIGVSNFAEYRTQINALVDFLSKNQAVAEPYLRLVVKLRQKCQKLNTHEEEAV